MLTQNTKALPQPDLSEAFKSISLLRSGARDLLNTDTSLTPVSASELLEMVRELKRANGSFKEIWNGLYIDVYLKEGVPSLVFAPDYIGLARLVDSKGGIASDSVMESWFKKNWVTLSDSGRITEIRTIWVSDDTPWDVRPLKPLTELRKLTLVKNPCNPGDLAELSQINKLELTTSDTSSLSPLTRLNLSSLIWNQCLNPDERTGNNTIRIDVAPIAEFKNLNRLTINADTQKHFYPSLFNWDTLVHLPDLTTLSLCMIYIGRQALNISLPQIRTLAISQSEIDDLSFLEKVESLEELALLNSNISFSSLKFPPTLKKLLLGYSNVETLAPMLRPLVGHPKIESVKLTQSSHRMLTEEDRSIIEQLEGGGVRVSRF